MDTNELKQNLQERIETAKRNMKAGKTPFLDSQRKELIADLEKQLKQIESK